MKDLDHLREREKETRTNKTRNNNHDKCNIMANLQGPSSNPLLPTPRSPHSAVDRLLLKQDALK